MNDVKDLFKEAHLIDKKFRKSYHKLMSNDQLDLVPSICKITINEIDDLLLDLREMLIYNLNNIQMHQNALKLKDDLLQYNLSLEYLRISLMNTDDFNKNIKENLN